MNPAAKIPNEAWFGEFDGTELHFRAEIQLRLPEKFASR
jgi:hypothetical protein